MGCFNNAGTCLWVKQNTSPYSNGPLIRPAIDAMGNVYVAAQVTNNDTFNTYVTSNAYGPYGVPMIMKMDGDGNLTWGKCGKSTAEIQIRGLVQNNNEVVVTGGYAGKLVWGTDSVIAYDCNYTPYLLRANATTGAAIKLDSLKNICGAMSLANAIANDKFGNVYVAGFFGSGLSVGGAPLVYAGGLSDFFVAKYGTATCSCTLPTAAFTSTGSSTRTFTYTGTAAYDSVSWNFGDGGTSSIPSPTHTFMAGTYTVCVTVYTSCGSDVHCETITVTGVGLTNTLVARATIYPNPANDKLFIDHISPGTHLAMYNMLGIKVYETVAINNTMEANIKTLPNGNYIVELRTTEGMRTNSMILKQ